MPPSPSDKPGAQQGSNGPIAFLIGGVVGASILALGTANRDDGPLEDDLAFYREVRELIGEEFVQERTDEQLLIAAIEGVVQNLDVYSRFYSGEDLTRIEQATSGVYYGLGVLLAEPTRDGVIRFPMAGSPAQRAGLTVGDRILEIDGVPLQDMASGEIDAKLRNLGRDPLNLLVQTGSEQAKTLMVQPENVINPTVRHGSLLDGSIGYLAIRSFSRRTLEEFDAEVALLQEEGMEELVIDLRNNPGGVLDIALSIANRFIAEGPLLYTDSRMGREEKQADPKEARLLGFPLVVLIDKDSASSSEVLAGTLQDHRAAVIAGMPSYGKGTVQTLTTLTSPRSILKVTTAFYTTPSGRQIDRQYSDADEAAITPDVLVPIGKELERAIRTQLDTYSPPRAYRAAVREQFGVAAPGGIADWRLDTQLLAATDLLQDEQEESL